MKLPVLLSTILLFVSVTSWVAAQDFAQTRTDIQSASELREDPDFKKLEGDWEVKSVTHDGNLTAAQIGQKAGDVISMVPYDGGLVLS